MICAQVVGTRCASTKFALSVYFCGAATANGEPNIWNGWAGALQAATGWTARANTLYKELFWVDVRENGDVRFSAANAIEDLWWQIRCKYPTAKTPPPPGPGPRAGESRGPDTSSGDRS